MKRGDDDDVTIGHSSLIPFIKTIQNRRSNRRNTVHLVSDGAKWHKGDENQKIRDACGYEDLPWPPNSPDLNPIENAWHIMKSRLHRVWRTTEERPHTAAELFVEAAVEWDRMPQEQVDKWISEMPRRLKAVIKAKGGHTKW